MVSTGLFVHRVGSSIFPHSVLQPFFHSLVSVRCLVDVQSILVLDWTGVTPAGRLYRLVFWSI